MSLNSIALWLGYGSMIVGSVVLLAAVLLLASLSCVVIANRGMKALIRIYDLGTLRKTMRQLEAEGKVSKKSEVNHG